MASRSGSSGWEGLWYTRNLRVWQKAVLAAIVLLIPFVIGLGRSVRQEYQLNIEFAQKEVAGAHVIGHLEHLLSDLQRLRVTAIAFASGDVALANQVGDVELKAVQTDLESIDSQEKQRQDYLGTTQKWSQIHDLVAATIKGAAKFRPADSLARFDDASSKLYEFIETLGDVSNLAQDPQLDTSYGFQILLGNCDIVRRMGRATELVASAGAVKQNINMDDATELIRLLTLIDHDEDRAETEYRKALDYNPKLSAKLDAGHTTFKSACDNFIDYVQTGVIANGGDTVRSTHAKLVDSVMGIDSFTDILAPVEVDLLVAREEAQDRNIQLNVLSAVIGILLVLFIGTFIVRDITRPLREVVRITRAIARGDLSMAVPQVRRGDEFGLLNQSLGDMVSNIRDILYAVGETVMTLSEATSQILVVAGEQAAVTTSMATAVNQTTTTVDQVKQIAQVASQRAGEVARSSQQAAQFSQSGRQATEQTLDEMQRIRERTEMIADSILRLSEQTHAVGEIVNSVNQLAEQSNLLAVNAAIQAAKAGEQGRGFAVVAQEVRHLAEQSKAATGQIKDILNDVQKATSGAVMLSEEGTKAVSAGLRQSQEAGEAIKALSARVMEAAQAATQIAQSAQQQVSGMDQVANAMSVIRGGSNASEQSMQVMQEYASRLHELSQHLRELTDRYRLS